MTTALAVRRAPAKPWCFVCRREVDTFEEVREDFIDRLVFVARCHGRVERVSLDGAEVRAMRSFQPGVAFRPAPVTAALSAIGET